MGSTMNRLYRLPTPPRRFQRSQRRLPGDNRRPSQAELDKVTPSASPARGTRTAGKKKAARKRPGWRPGRTRLARQRRRANGNTVIARRRWTMRIERLPAEDAGSASTSRLPTARIRTRSHGGVRQQHIRKTRVRVEPTFRYGRGRALILTRAGTSVAEEGGCAAFWN
jgi:hypothetical protein